MNWLLPILITFTITYFAWLTTNIFNSEAHSQKNSVKITILEQNHTEIRQELKNIQQQIQQNQKDIMNLLLDIQKQINRRSICELQNSIQK